MGLMNFIRQNLPESWEKAATELRMKNELVIRLHANIPRIYKNKYHYKEGMRYIRSVFQTSADKLIYYVEATDIDVDKWNKLANKIKEKEYQCAQYLGGFGLIPNQKKESSRKY